MADLDNLCLYTVQRNDRWLVASNESPYFCFEADSKDGALEIALRALEFYKSVTLDDQQQEGCDPVNLDWHAVPARELVAA